MEYKVQPGRDAHAAIAGFVYQVTVTIQRWLTLGPGEHLELEAGEDIDIVRREMANDTSAIARDVEQVHKSARTLTLRSKKVRQAIVNFCGLRILNPNSKFRFRFVTTAKAAREIGAQQPGIALWEAIRVNDLTSADQLAAIEQIGNRLKGGRKPRGVTTSAWVAFQGLLSDPRPAQLIDLILGFEWAMGQGDPEAFEAEVRRRLSEMRPGQPPASVTRAFTHLFAYVFRLLSRPGPKLLTTDILMNELTHPSITEEDRTTAEWLLHRLGAIEGRLTEVEETVQRHLTEEQPKTFFQATASGREQGSGSLFNFDQVFRGRRVQLDALDSLLESPESLIAIVVGRGGIGKTKLLREWSGGKGDWSVLWTNESIAWQPTTDREIPARDTLLIVDDAHRYPYLAQVIGMVSSWRGPHNLKLVIAARPSGRSYVNEKLAQFVDESRLIRCAPLHSLTQRETVDLAVEMLGSEYHHLSSQLAAVSLDSPLVAVVGGRLIAKGEISPKLLANHELFQRAVFDKFASECMGPLPAGGRPREDLLHLITAVQPVNEQEQPFDAKAQEFLGWKSYEIRKNVFALEEIGIAIRRGNAIRIVPDVLADYLLEQASVGPNHMLTGYPDAVFEAFHESHLSNLLQNLAELDWRITQRDPETRLLDGIWARIRETFRAQKARPRRQLLEALAGVAPFQPQAVHSILQIAMDEEAETSYDYGLFKVTSEDALRKLPELLTATLFDEKTSADSFRRLWRLSQNGTGELQRRARRALEEAIGYKKYKSLSLNESVLSLVEELAADPDAYATDFTPLDIVENLLDREIGHTERVGGSFSVSTLQVNYENIRPLRQRALAVIARCLSSSNAGIAVSAVDALSKVLSEYHPNMRMEVTEEEQRWQDGERLYALEILQKRIEEGSLSRALTWRICKLLGWLVERARLTEPVKERAARILGTISPPPSFEVFDVICSDEWEYNTLEDDFVLVSTRRTEQESRAVADLAAPPTSIEQRIATVEGLVEEARSAGIALKGLDPLVTRLCGDPEFLSAFSEYLLTSEQSVLLGCAGFAVRCWRLVDQARYAYFGCGLASHRSWRAAASVASYLGPHLDQPTLQDIQILTLLVGRKEPSVLAATLFDLTQLGKVPRFRATALSLILSIDLGDNEFLSRSLCDVVGPGRLSPSFLDGDEIRRMLEKLVVINELPEQSFSTFVAYVGGHAPLALVRFFEARLTRAMEVERVEGYTPYQPIPSLLGWSSFAGLRESPDYRAALEQLFGLLRRFPAYRDRLIHLFWRFGFTDETTFSVLNTALETSNRDNFVDVLSLLTEAPKDVAFNHVDFAVNVLNRCASHSSELGEAAMQVLKGNCLSLGRGGFAVGGTPIPIWNGVSERAAAILASCEPNSPAHRLYLELATVMPSHLPIVAPQFDDED
jgi:hypothetical protein